MQRFVSGIRQRIQKMNLSQRLVLSLVVVVVAIIIFSGVPANLAMWRALEKQVWLRVQDAQLKPRAVQAEVNR
jgi:hypothetical protein